VGTTFIEGNQDSSAVCTKFAKKKPRNPDQRVTFPVTIEYYDQRAKIDAPAKRFPFNRIAFKVAGKRRMLTFGSYGEAKHAARPTILIYAPLVRILDKSFVDYERRAKFSYGRKSISIYEPAVV
jgi:hypothetical protein